MTKKRNIIVVGSGLFGSIAATLARHHGHTVTVVNEKRPYAASPASGCVLAPSWLSSLSKDAVADSMSVLQSLYTVHDLVFQTNLLKKFRAQRVSLGDVLVEPDLEARVTSVGDGWVEYAEPHSAGTARKGKLRCDAVLVATGIWCRELLKDMPEVRGLYGCSLSMPGQLPEPRISVYAPYKQSVGFNLDRKRVWFGDGTTLIERTWEKEEAARVAKTTERGHAMLDTLPVRKPTVTIGARPYVEGHKAGYFQRISPKVWVSTGGAKNGTVLAAWQALQFVKALS